MGILLDFVNSDTLGIFILSLRQETNYLQFSKLGYKSDSIPIKQFLSNGDSIHTIVLDTVVNILPEFVIKAKKVGFIINGDTITYPVSSYRDLATKDLKDLLDNIPNFEVGENGLIKYNGHVISKILLDGKDIITGSGKNTFNAVSISDILDVQIINQYNDGSSINDLNKGPALNINTKRTGKILGIVKAGYGLKNRFNLISSLYQSTSKRSTYYNLNFNNIFEEAISVIEYINLQTNLFKSLNAIKSDNSGLDGLEPYSIAPNVNKNKDIMLSIRDEKRWKNGINSKFTIFGFYPKRNFNYSFFRLCNCGNGDVSGNLDKLSKSETQMIHLKVSKIFDSGTLIDLQIPISYNSLSNFSKYSNTNNFSVLNTFNQSNIELRSTPNFSLFRPYGKGWQFQMNAGYYFNHQIQNSKIFSRDSLFNLDIPINKEGAFEFIQELNYINNSGNFDLGMYRKFKKFNTGLTFILTSERLDAKTNTSFDFKNNDFNIRNNKYKTKLTFNYNLNSNEFISIIPAVEINYLYGDFINQKLRPLFSPSISYINKRDVENKLVISYDRSYVFRNLVNYLPIQYLVDERTVSNFQFLPVNYAIQDAITANIRRSFIKCTYNLNFNYINFNDKLSTIDQLKSNFIYRTSFVIPSAQNFSANGFILLKINGIIKNLGLFANYNFYDSKLQVDGSLKDLKTNRFQSKLTLNIVNNNIISIKCNYDYINFTSKIDLAANTRPISNNNHILGSKLEFNYNKIRILCNVNNVINSKLVNNWRIDFDLIYNPIIFKKENLFFSLSVKNPHLFKTKLNAIANVYDYYIEYLFYENKINYLIFSLNYRI